MSGLLAALVLSVVAACGAGAPQPADDTPTLTWWSGPDRADLDVLAASCTTAADGRYRIEVRELPADAEERHAEVVRRLLAQDDSIDLLSIDMAWSAELAAAQVLAPVPEDLKAPFAADVAPAALAATTVDDLLVAAPWWFDPYLLWWRGNAAERAGLDPEKPIRWDDLVAGAERTGRQVVLDDADGEGVAAWVVGMLAGGGGTLLEGASRSPEVGLAGSAGKGAATIGEYLADSGVGSAPSPDAALAVARRGGFALAPSSFVTDPALAPVASDLQWTAYPRVDEDAAVPATGVALAVPLHADRTDLSYDAVSCLTSDESLAALMTGSGHSAARLSLYDTEAITQGYPLGDVTRPSLEDAVTLPQTPYWMRARAALVDTWTPLASIDPGTPQRSADAVRRAVAGGLS